ncbi:MAG: right-handed parallel beta-helix repeat-containing protein [Bacteroidia bacterium]|nr:right-handed parallel beta-helix repeat-containing protein [Bacteroidia bacterium]
MKRRITYLAVIVFLISFEAYAKEYHVSVNGNDNNSGSLSQPFSTISAAAKIALPGDVITVHEGTYREWVNPAYSGTNDLKRIVYQAAPGEKVIIKGSEVIKNWEKTGNGVWKTIIKNSFFGEYNPYREIIKGDWFSDKGRIHHTGEVYLNGKSLYEIDSLERVKYPKILKDALDEKGSAYQWYCESNFETTTIWANFHDYNPNKELVEINVRQACFFPKKTGINYITVKGFTMSQAATQWAPPTAEQIGLIGPNWSKGWIIEDNVISDSKCSGISLGKERSTGQNQWTELKIKHGTQREREVIFNALAIGWSKENIGSHIVRNNIIFNCEQTGICGHLGAIFSSIYNNHIYNINVKRQFSGAEIAGIKLHAAIDVLIKNNRIHDTFRGLWLDWQAQGARVTGNLLYNNKSEDIFIEVCHGPYIVDNNILLSENSIRNFSQGGAFVHNLIAGKMVHATVLNRFTPYHFQHSTGVAGLMTIIGGDDRYFNNIFIGNETSESSQKKPDTADKYGLEAYDDYPIESDIWLTGRSVDDYAKIKMPVFIGSNLYLNDAKPYKKETNIKVNAILKPELSLEEKGNEVFLHINTDESFSEVNCKMITTKLLGYAIQSEAPFENTDGTTIEFATDYFGIKRNETNPGVGPFETLSKGRNIIKVWYQK